MTTDNNPQIFPLIIAIADTAFTESRDISLLLAAHERSPLARLIIEDLAHGDIEDSTPTQAIKEAAASIRTSIESLEAVYEELMLVHDDLADGFSLTQIAEEHLINEDELLLHPETARYYVSDVEPRTDKSNADASFVAGARWAIDSFIRKLATKLEERLHGRKEETDQPKTTN